MVLFSSQLKQLSPEDKLERMKESLPLFLAELAAIPNDEKKSYLEALDRAPLLLETETPWQRFVSCEEYDAALAAQRFVRYWEKRHTLFGDRAFRPLLSSPEDISNAALNQGDLSILRSGHATMLPKDSEGRVVLAMETSFVPPPVPDVGNCRLRTLFYLLHTASETPSSQQDGIVGIFIFDEPVLDDRSIAFGLELLGDSLPIRLHFLHAVVLPSKKARANLDNFFERVLPCIVRLSGEFHGSGKRCGCLLGHSSPEKVMMELRDKHHMVPDSLPQVIGGAKSSGELLNQWLTQQEGIEKASQEQKTTGMADLTPFPQTAQTTGEPLSKQERDSRNSVRHSRKKRIKQRAQKESLEIQSRHLASENDLFRRENSYLENLLAQAKQVIASLPSEEHQQPNAAGGSVSSLPHPSAAVAPSSVSRLAPDDALSRFISVPAPVNPTTTATVNNLLSSILNPATPVPTHSLAAPPPAAAASAILDQLFGLGSSEQERQSNAQLVAALQSRNVPNATGTTTTTTTANLVASLQAQLQPQSSSSSQQQIDGILAQLLQQQRQQQQQQLAQIAQSLHQEGSLRQSRPDLLQAFLGATAQQQQQQLAPQPPPLSTSSSSHPTASLLNGTVPSIPAGGGVGPQNGGVLASLLLAPQTTTIPQQQQPQPQTMLDPQLLLSRLQQQQQQQPLGQVQGLTAAPASGSTAVPSPAQGGPQDPSGERKRPFSSAFGDDLP